MSEQTRSFSITAVLSVVSGVHFGDAAGRFGIVEFLSGEAITPFTFMQGNKRPVICKGIIVQQYPLLADFQRLEFELPDDLSGVDLTPYLNEARKSCGETVVLQKPDRFPDADEI